MWNVHVCKLLIGILHLTQQAVKFCKQKIWFFQNQEAKLQLKSLFIGQSYY